MPDHINSLLRDARGKATFCREIGWVTLPRPTGQKLSPAGPTMVRPLLPGRRVVARQEPSVRSHPNAGHGFFSGIADDEVSGTVAPGADRESDQGVTHAHEDRPGGVPNPDEPDGVRSVHLDGETSVPVENAVGQHNPVRVL